MNAEKEMLQDHETLNQAKEEASKKSSQNAKFKFKRMDAVENWYKEYNYSGNLDGPIWSSQLQGIKFELDI